MIDHELVRLIFKDTYNFYTKWKGISNPDDFAELMKEVREINEKYDFDLCRKILLELVDAIEKDFIARRDRSE